MSVVGGDDPKLTASRFNDRSVSAAESRGDETRRRLLLPRKDSSTSFSKITS